MQVKLGPAPGGRHLAIVYRGTGGIIGEDIVSRVCQGATDLLEERNPDWDATMGGIPVGTAPIGPGLSMNRAVEAGFEAGKAEFLDQRRGRPDVKVVVGGYSAGAVVAARLRQALAEFHAAQPDLPGMGLERLRLATAPRVPGCGGRPFQRPARWTGQSAAPRGLRPCGFAPWEWR